MIYIVDDFIDSNILSSVNEYLNNGDFKNKLVEIKTFILKSPQEFVNIC